MRKFTKIFLVIFSAVIFLISDIESSRAENSDMKLRSGTFMKIMARDEISTLTADIEDEVSFINSSDLYVYETNAVPQNTIFYGEIEDLLEPVEGRDAALKIKINKMITPDKKVYKIKGHIYSENDNYLGGKETEPVYYRKVPHYNRAFRPMLQAAPLNIYEMGKHTIVLPGAELFLILEEDIILK